MAFTSESKLPIRQQRVTRWLVGIFAIWCGVVAVLVALAQALTTDPVVRAVLRMALGVMVLWIGGAGTLSLAGRAWVQRWFQYRPRAWQLAFVLGATAMACLEEAVTTAMTNLAPRWGLTIAQAHITASGDYLDVILLHSVVVFIPMFCAWSWLLTRYAFTPAAVLVLFGITGALAEGISFGINPIATGFWVFVYGLMVYLPAHAAPPQRAARTPGRWAALLAIVLPIFAAVPVVFVVQAVHARWFAGLP